MTAGEARRGEGSFATRSYDVEKRRKAAVGSSIEDNRNVVTNAFQFAEKIDSGHAGHGLTGYYRIEPVGAGSEKLQRLHAYPI